MDSSFKEKQRGLATGKLTRRLWPLLIVAALFLALYLLYGALRKYNYHDLVTHVNAYPAGLIVFALALTALNYLVLTFYDVLALRFVRKKLPYGRTAFTSFMSYVFSYNVGFSIFGSSALRYRFYSSWGIDGITIAKIITFCVSSFWIGLAVMGGGSLILAPLTAAVMPALAGPSRLIGVLLIAVVVAYLFLCLKGRQKLKIGSFSLDLPDIRIAASQTVLASMDWLLAALVLYILLPEGRPAFLPFVGVFATAQLIGATSHIPGGIGVFESIIVLSLSSRMSAAQVLGSLLVYRGVYYLAPLTLAVVAFVSREIWVIRQGISSSVRKAAHALAPFIPAVLSVAVFFSGAVLLFSGATPGVVERLVLLDPLIPLQVLELSHFMGSMIGLALLVIADAIRRRVDASYYLALGLLMAGAVSSILKGLDWEEALILCSVALLLLPSRSLFYRKAALLAPSSFFQWFAAMGIVIAVSIWLGLFSYKHVPYSDNLWWIFKIDRNAPRFLRASLGVGLGTALIAFRVLLSSVPRMPHISLCDCRSEVSSLLAVTRSSSANLALLGDKYFYFSEDRSSFLMYGQSGRTIVVMGDPVGNAERFSDLIWDFYELTSRQGIRLVWYEISGENIPIFVELGARILKVGEDASVDLEAFTLEGGRARGLRPPRNKVLREGYSFKVIPREEVASRMENLKKVSDEWLATRKSKEKGFSLGFFDAEYLMNFPCAIVEKEGRIVAFANIWTGGTDNELSVDLMRYSSEAPSGTMEFLFVECMLWGKEQGYRSFNMGMAPLSGVEARNAAPLWNKIVTLIFRNGEGIYNFQGLRDFKDKFHPKWSPMYIAVPPGSGGPNLPAVAVDIAQLVSGPRPKRRKMKDGVEVRVPSPASGAASGSGSV